MTGEGFIRTIVIIVNDISYILECGESKLSHFKTESKNQ